MEQVELVAYPRIITGKKVKRLRSEGLIPLVVYGRKTASTNIQAAELDTRRALHEASGQLIALNIEGEDSPRMTLARDVQRDSISGSLLHVDLYEVDMTETIEVEVSLTLTGEPPLVEAGEAVIVPILNSVEIECLPTDILQSIEVDVSRLVDLDDAIHVRDLVVPENVQILTPGDEMIVKLEPVLEEEEEEEEEFELPSALEVEVIQRGKAEEEEAEEEEE